MKRTVFIVVALAAAIALAIACARNRVPHPGTGDAAFHSPIQPLDRSVLSSIPSGHRDFRRDPPIAQNVTAEPMSGNQVRVQVLFAEKNLPPVLNIETEQEPVALRDDGKNGDAAAADGIFTAITELPPEFMRDRQRVRDVIASTGGERSVFRNRQLVPIRTTIDVINRLAIISPFDIPFVTSNTDPDRSLFIIDPAVVNDPTRAGNPCVSGSNAMGPWSFGFLMNEMANTPSTGISGSDFAERWLNSWMVNQTINGTSVPKRINVDSQILTPWHMASGGPNAPLDLAKAPFHLVAIVNRLDLGDNPGYGGPANPGELRFVFGLLDGCSPTRFAVIFEFGVPPKSCPRTRTLAQAWQNLSTMTPGSGPYNTALQALTDPVVTHGAMPSKPNGSALNQLRTNEIALSSPWELREFRINGSSRLLQETTVKQTPIATLNGSATFASYVNTFQTDILLRRDVVPMQFPSGSPYLAGNAPIPPSFWNAFGINNNNARNLASLATCSGCHRGETNTPFVHVNPNTPIGSPAALSGFLTGITVADPADGVTPRTYDDLLDRKNKLDAKASSPCFVIAVFDQPLRMVH
jgi:hypothetical protein